MFSKLFTYKRSFAILSAALLLTLSACSGDDYYDDDDDFISECSIVGQNRFVYDVLDQWYLWNDSLPQVNPDTFNSPDALLDTLVANAPEVDRFSYIADQASSDAFFNDGQFTGLGFTSRNINNQLFLALVFSGSPAETAGLERGFEITSVDGVDVASTLAAGNNVSFGDNNLGISVDITYVDLSGAESSTTLIKENINVDTVSTSRVIDNNGVNTGYLHFYTFIQPSTAALDTTFREFNNANVDELIVDLRYNGGGLGSVAEEFADLIGGSSTSGEIFYDQLFNADRAADNDRRVRFIDSVNSLDLSRVVFITDAGTASASELIINGLSPFLNVVLVGDTTFGKPVGQLGFNFCGNTLFPVTFETANANNEGRFFDGLAVDCPAEDDLTRELGNENEASLAEALSYLNTGACSPTAVTVANKRAEKSKNSNKAQAIIKDWKLLDAH